ncbi:class I SAM-dependent DNA methyltransferase [Geodermatophilus dictyosporus]|uniref:class I SAM-dependent DNA methyltransferase n=1 Tax=Geodermatophilus dictyosporus TaxID=1523247 RepID=UPI000B8431FC|nr:class I SAM-dependent methyltransferase [Geodermatophilus dictyosporus]
MTDLLARTRTAYDTVAPDYADLLRDELDRRPLDRALLGVLAEDVHRRGGGPVGDLGCGPGRVAAHLHRLGVDVVGVDLSPAMLRVARRDHPRLPLAVGALAALPLADRVLAGALAWYSLIHTPPALLPGLCAELRRVLADGAPLLLAFQAGDGGEQHLARAYGHDVDLPVFRHDPDVVVGCLARAGLAVRSTTVRAPELPECTAQVYVTAVREEHR